MRIVIVDDKPVNLKLMESLVKRANTGYQPLTFQDSAEGLFWCLNNVADLLIVNYMMPAPDGLEATRNTGVAVDESGIRPYRCAQLSTQDRPMLAELDWPRACTRKLRFFYRLSQRLQRHDVHHHALLPFPQHISDQPIQGDAGEN